MLIILMRCITRFFKGALDQKVDGMYLTLNGTFIIHMESVDCEKLSDFSDFFFIFGFSTPPGPATSQVSTKCHECKHHRALHSLGISISLNSD